MGRISFIILRMNVLVIYYFLKICGFAKKDPKDYEGIHQLLQKACRIVLKKGRITPIIEGIENIPEKDGFMYYPNHQGLFDVLMFLMSSPKSFAFVLKQELGNIILLKQIIAATGSLSMDRKDLRQSIRVINDVTEQVKNGRNFLIFAEGTRSKMGNKLNDLKGGSFKAACNAKCPIVPCALVDSYRPFDEKGIKPITVKLRYLKPIPYEEYKDMKSADLAKEVKTRIEEAIADMTNTHG